MAREPEPTRRRARGGVVAEPAAVAVAAGEARPAARLRFVEGVYLTDDRRLIEVRRVVIRCTADGEALEKHVMVENAAASCDGPPDLIRMAESDFASGWRMVELIPFDVEKASHLWEGARG